MVIQYLQIVAHRNSNSCIHHLSCFFRISTSEIHNAFARERQTVLQNKMVRMFKAVSGLKATNMAKFLLSRILDSFGNPHPTPLHIQCCLGEMKYENSVPD